MEASTQNDLLAVLVEMRNGQLAIDLNSKFGDLMAAIRETRNKGSINLKLAVEPSEIDIHEGVKAVKITPTVTLSAPQKGVPPALFFVTQDGALSRTDPAQFEMFGESEEVGTRKEVKDGRK